MASTGKKSKKVKGKTLALNDFLAVTPGTYVTKNWADDEDENETTGYASRPRGPLVLPSASRATRGGACDEDQIPRHPPFVAHISNLPYEVDEESIADLFTGLKVSNLRLPRESEGKLRGFGYVDFEDRESLIAAMNIPDLVINGRPIKISVSTSDNDRRQGRRNDRDRDREYDPERTAGNWRTTNRPDADSGKDDNRRNWGYNRDRGRESSATDNTPGGWREGKSEDEPVRERGGENRAYGGRGSYGDRDRGYQRDREPDRDRGSWRDRDNDKDRDSDKGFRRDGDRDRDRDRYDDRDRGGYARDRYRDNERSYGRREYGGDRDRDKEKERDRDSDADKEAVQRPKLQLKPRTIPLEIPVQPVQQGESDKGGDTGGEGSDKEDERKPPPQPKPTANIFGSAKPVDTAAREREIEERLAKKQTEPKYKDDGSKDRDERKSWNKDKKSDKEEDDRRPPRRNDDRRRNDERSSRPVGRNSRDRRDNKDSEDKSIEREYSNSREREMEDRDRPMPKAKELVPPNFVASNKFSSLENADDEEVSD